MSDEDFYSPTHHYGEDAIQRARNMLDSQPELIGPYRIVEKIGGGGMGEVYRAQQKEPISRKVAIKFIKLGKDTKEVIARFEAERQALALMDHPHISKVFDAGADNSGRPFFVMEYVKGEPITEYADRHQLTIKERLELVEQVCQAVQHAHHKGVIHRDLKPSNILVSTHDGKPFAKVIDFGVAKALGQQLTDKTIDTLHEQLVGTPQYMSPEQAEGSLDIDTRSDVYSLGVLIYELLTGSPPFSTTELKIAAFEALKKLILEVDPPTPSSRLTENQKALATLAATRRVDPKRLGTLVRGELDWIVMKALEKDRHRRYETPTSLAKDLKAHVQGEAIQAAPPSVVYRIKKFTNKHRSSILVSAIVLTSLLVGISGFVWQQFKQVKTDSIIKESELRAVNAEQESLLATEKARIAEAEKELVDARSEVIKREAAASRYTGILGQFSREEYKRSPGWAERSWELLREATAIESSVKNSSEIRTAAAIILVADEFRQQPDWVYERARCIDYSPDGQFVALCVYADNLHPSPRIHVLSSATGERILELTVQDRWLNGRGTGRLRSRFSHTVFVDDNTLLALTENGRLFHFDLSVSPPDSRHIDFEADEIVELISKPGVNWCAMRLQQKGVLRIWDWKNFKVIAEIPGIPEHCEYFLLSPDWSYLCWRFGEQTKCYSLPDLKELKIDEKKIGAIFHPYSELYVHTDEDGIKGYGWPNRVHLHDYVMPEDFVYAEPKTLASTKSPSWLNFSESGHFLKMKYDSERGTGLHLWDAWGGPIRSTLVVPSGENPKWDAFSFSNDDSKIAMLTEKTRQFSRIRQTIAHYRAEGHPDGVRQITVTPKQQIGILGERNPGKADSLIVRNFGATPNRFEPAAIAPDPLPIGSIPPKATYELSHSPDGRLIVVLGNNSAGGVTLQTVCSDPIGHYGTTVEPESEKFGVPSFNPGKLAGIGWSRDGSMVIVADTQIQAYQTKIMPPSETDRLVSSTILKTPSQYVNLAMRGTNTGWALTHASELREVEYEAGQLAIKTQFIVPGQGGSKVCSINSNNRHLAIGKVDGSVLLFDTSKRQFGSLHSTTHLNVVQAMIWINENRLITGDKDGTLAIWDVNEQGKLELWYRLNIDAPIVDIAPTQSKTAIYVACQDETSLRVYDLAAIDSAIHELFTEPNVENKLVRQSLPHIKLGK